ncbi:MAG: ATP-dependent DNA helicase UvrD2 [Arcanobacterium sp.]
MEPVAESAEDLLAHLDPEQREVATNLRGPLAVLAGAGTGKTRAITYRIAYAVRSGVYDPRNILAVTFTARAAGEMRSRLRDLGVGTVQARTFHAAALNQLQYFWPSAVGGFVPEIKENKGALVATAAAQLGMKTDSVSVRDLAAEIEWSKVNLLTPQQYAQQAGARGRTDVAGYTAREIAALINVYEDVKVDRGVIDFEDVIIILIGIMRDRPDITRIIRNQYRHFVVDEYQDVSPMQHRLLQLWMGDRRDLCVVGDVSQTIYSFAGARSDYLAQFTAEFPRAKVVQLNRNYRSTPQIVDLANKVISDNRQEGAVYLRSMHKSGRPVSFAAYGDDADEAAQIAGKILSLQDEGIPLSQIAVLYRTNAQSAAFETALNNAGISYALRGSERFFQRREVKEAMITFGAVAKLPQHEDLPDTIRAALVSLGWRPEPPQERGAVRECWDSLATLLELAEEMWNKRRATIEDYVAELKERMDVQYAPTTEAVTLSSLHAAKGLEWPVVFLAGMSEGLMPISHAKDKDTIAEERRLLYVGITRAQEELHVSYAGQSAGRAERKLSRFLTEYWPQPKARSTAARHKAKARALQFQHEHPEDMQLFEDLRAWRRALAEELGRRPYTIFHDVVLQEIAIHKPRNLAELGRIKGIGTTKLTSFGPEVLRIVNNPAIGSGR